MRKQILFILLIFLSTAAFSQTDSITMRENITLQYRIRNTLLPAYEKLMNFIADPTTQENEIPDVIKTMVFGSREQRVFNDKDVIVENDLKPGGDTNKYLRHDQDIVAYLNSFHLGYKKSEDKTVFLGYLSLSPLKYTTYFYYNLFFSCRYEGKNSSGQSFHEFNRIAEIKIVNDSGWHAYINGIRFVRDNENDTLHMFRNLITSDTDLVKIFNAYDMEEKKRIYEQRVKIHMLVEEGKDYYSAGNNNEALKKFYEARMINYDAPEPKEWTIKVRKELERKKAEESERARREQRVVEMQKEVRQNIARLNFVVAKKLCDSLVIDYQVTDTAIASLSSELSLMNASIESINSARSKGKISEGILICQQKQKTTRNLFFQSHFYFLEAQLLAAEVKPQVKLISEKLTKAIDLSEKKHQEALKMRALLRVEKLKDINGAVEDATLVVNNDARNPEVYDFRATVYEKDNNFPAAIRDYDAAILNKTKDVGVFQKKAAHEYFEKRYDDAIRSASGGLEIMKCNGVLLYYKGLSEFYTGKYIEAGADLRKAKVCGVADTATATIKAISDSCVREGYSLMHQKAWYRASNEFTRAIHLDSNQHALYSRAACSIKIQQYDSAAADLTKLEAMNPSYKNVYALRGRAFSGMKKYPEANKDFETALKKYPQDPDSYSLKGQSLLDQEKYPEAVESFDQALNIQQSDSLYYLISLASFYNKEYDKAIKLANKGKSKSNNQFEIYYICGRAWYEKGDYKSALEEFAVAKSNISFDDGLFFWNASALELSKKYPAAIADYGQLNKSEKYKDTALFRAAVCRIKSGEFSGYPMALNQLDQYVKVVPAKADLSSAYAWKAYAHLEMDSQPQASTDIAEAKKYNEKNPMLLLVLACKSVKNQQEESACEFLDRALSTKQFNKDEIESIAMLAPLKKKNEKYKILMKKHFP